MSSDYPNAACNNNNNHIVCIILREVRVELLVGFRFLNIYRNQATLNADRDEKKEIGRKIELAEKLNLVENEFDYFV